VSRGERFEFDAHGEPGESLWRRVPVCVCLCARVWVPRVCVHVCA